ncbi:hypothetical protein C1X64_26785 [Pseudomonas sp. GW456-E7]|nr:hypothetical protein C1X64_26785 [Pseudomonas sp. GW456-E7]
MIFVVYACKHVSEGVAKVLFNVFIFNAYYFLILIRQAIKYFGEFWRKFRVCYFQLHAVASILLRQARRFASFVY